MPKKYHDKVARSAKKRGLKPGSERYNAYVYGTLNKIEKRHKGKQRRRRHK